MSTDWSEEQPSIELLKSTVTMYDVVELLGLEPDSQGKIISPWNPDERTPSCHVYEDHVYCYSTGHAGDIVDLVQALAPGTSWRKAVWMLWNRALRSGKEPGDVETAPVREVVDFSEELAKYHVGHPLWADVIGCPLPPTVRQNEVTGDLLIPHQDQDGVYGVKIRAQDGAKTSWPGSQFTKRLYSPWGWQLNSYATTAIITEGESDAWHVSALTGDGEFDQYRQPEVFALPSGAGSWKDSWLKDLEPYTRVILIMDNDRAGEQARDKLTRKIGWGRVENSFVPALYNDVREAVANGWRGLGLVDRV